MATTGPLTPGTPGRRRSRGSSTRRRRRARSTPPAPADGGHRAGHGHAVVEAGVEVEARGSAPPTRRPRSPGRRPRRERWRRATRPGRATPLEAVGLLDAQLPDAAKARLALRRRGGHREDRHLVERGDLRRLHRRCRRAPTTRATRVAPPLSSSSARRAPMRASTPTKPTRSGASSRPGTTDLGVAREQRRHREERRLRRVAGTRHSRAAGRPGVRVTDAARAVVDAVDGHAGAAQHHLGRGARARRLSHHRRGRSRRARRAGPPTSPARWPPARCSRSRAAAPSP